MFCLAHCYLFPYIYFCQVEHIEGLYKQEPNKHRYYLCVYTICVYILCVYTVCCVYTMCVVYTVCVYTVCVYTICVYTICVYTYCVYPNYTYGFKYMGVTLYPGASQPVGYVIVHPPDGNVIVRSEVRISYTGITIGPLQSPVTRLS